MNGHVGEILQEGERGMDVDPTASSPHRQRVSHSTLEPTPGAASTSIHSSIQSQSRLQPHRRSTSWQLSESEPHAQSSPSLPYSSCPSSPSPSSVSRASSGSSTPSRRPLPFPPVNSPRFVPFRPLPPPPPSLANPPSASEEKRELARLRGLDDLVEREGESEEDNDSSSPTLSDLPAYEGRELASSSLSAHVGKGLLLEREREQALEVSEAGELEKGRVELENVRRRVNEESVRLIEEDSRSGKERLIAQREQEAECSRTSHEYRVDAERHKGLLRALEEEERERVESPPPPLSPTAQNLLPLHESKVGSHRAESSFPVRESPRRDKISQIPSLSHRLLPSPPPPTIYSTPFFSSVSGARPPPALRSRPSRDVLSVAPTPPISSLPFESATSFYGGSFAPSMSSNVPSTSRVENQRQPSERRNSVTAVSSFYSTAVGLTIDQLRLDRPPPLPSPSLHSKYVDHGRQSQQPSESTSDSNQSQFDLRPRLSPPPARATSERFSPDLDPARQTVNPPLVPFPRHPPPLGEPAFYHSIEGQLLPFYPTSSSSSDPNAPRTFFSPSSAKRLLPNSPSPDSQTNASIAPSPHLRRPSPSLSDQPSKSRANRMSTIKSLFGRARGKGQDELMSGHDYGVREGPVE